MLFFALDLEHQKPDYQANERQMQPLDATFDTQTSFRANFKNGAEDLLQIQ